MTMNVFGLTFGAAALSAALWVGIDFEGNPPAVMTSGPWVEDCERVENGVRVELAGEAPDLWFDFVGLPEGVSVGFVALGAEDTPIASGLGPWVPLSRWEGVEAVSFYALSEGEGWDEVSAVKTRETDATEVGRTKTVAQAGEDGARVGTQGLTTQRAARAASSSAGFPLVKYVTATATLSTDDDTLKFAGMTKEEPTKEIGSLGEILDANADIPYGEKAFSVSVSGGSIRVGANTTFRAGADDTALLTVGGKTSSIDGEHALVWGNEETIEAAGIYPVSAEFSSVGGPYDFRIEGLPDLRFCEQTGVIPYANLRVQPSVVEVPWSGETVSGSVTFGPRDARVTYGEIVCEGSYTSLYRDTFSVDGDAFLRAGAESETVKFSAEQTYEGMSCDSSATLTIRRGSTTLSVDGCITVTNATKGETLTGVGADEPYLSYRLTGCSENLRVVDAEALQVEASDALWVKARNGEIANGPVSATVDWEAFYKGTQVASGTAQVAVRVEVTAKVKPDATGLSGDCACACAEGTETEVDAGCVSFRQAFGRTPFVEGMPIGALAIEEERLSDGLFTPAALRYDHPMLRRLDPKTRLVTTPMGWTIAYGEDGRPCGTDVAMSGRLVEENGVTYEVFSDRSRVEYGTDGAVAALISPRGVRVTPDELGISVTYDTAGNLARVESVTDGTLEVTVASPTAYTVAWTNAEGGQEKSFVFSKEGDDTLLLMDGPFPVRWRWVPAAGDFEMTRGNGAEAVTTARTVAYAGESITVSKTVRRGGVPARTETETIDAKNGNAAVGGTVGGRTTLAATRVESGNGLGRRASETDERGLTTAYTYDAEGRTLTVTETGAGQTRVTSHVYTADPLDRRPWLTTETVDGVTVRTDSFMEATGEDGGLIEATAECGLLTTTFYYPADAQNRVEAGRVRARVRPDGRMTAYAYAYDAAAGTMVATATEGIDTDGFGTFATVPGKSTRTLTTTDARGDAVRIERQALIGEAWVPLTWEERTYNAAHQHTGSTFSNGKTTDSAWICTGPLWEIDELGIVTTNVYDSVKLRVSSTRYGPRGALTTTYARDAEGRETGTTRGTLASSATYDLSGRLTSETDEQGLTTTYAYPDERTTVTTLPGGGTRVVTLDAAGRVASVTGTAVTPEWHIYGSDWELVHYGEENGARWTKTFTDGLGRVVREERAGANGSVLTTVNTYNAKGQLVQVERTGQATVVYGYDEWGDRVSTQVGDRATLTEETEWILVDSEPWQETTRTAAGLTESVRVDAEGERQVATDVRGNETETTVEDSGAWRTTTVQRPGVANAEIEWALDGLPEMTVDTANAIRSMTYDVYGRLVSETDGRGNTVTRTYDALGRLASVEDEAGAVTAYGYDGAGRVNEVTNALGNVTVYAYDVRGRLTNTGGSVYPVSYEYDVYGNRTKMTTFRDEEGEGDVTVWTYNAATGAVVSKTYADGRGPTYTLTDLGQVATRTDARGTVTTYAYNPYGDLVSQTYSDGTPSVTYAYDSLGRQTQATDAAGTTTFTYGQYGELVSESVSGGYAKTLTRHTEAFGRDVGYSIDGVRQRTLAYDADTGRLSGMDGFVWDYLPGSDLKSKLTYPNGATAEWAYEPKRDLLTQVKNTIHGTLASQYDYTNDLLGRRTAIGKSGSMMAQTETQDYAYNVRDELISGQGYTYAYDDIGNRTAAEGRDYVANNLNQYTAIDDFAPEYDLDGNQTKVQTETGVWEVTYNAENRPIRWEQGETVIEMAFDRLGRRVWMREREGDTVTKEERFVYDGYLCVQRLDAMQGNAVRTEFVWDPTEPVATRPLAMRAKNWGLNLFYSHDGNKNVSEVFYHAPQNGIAAHYDYAPFGAVTRTSSATRVTNRDLISENPFRFSSEYHDAPTSLVYYNYRHYNPLAGRWLGRDQLFPSQYSFCDNQPESNYDELGNLELPMHPFIIHLPPERYPREELLIRRYGDKPYVTNMSYPIAFTRPKVTINANCVCDEDRGGLWVIRLSGIMYISTYIYEEGTPVDVVVKGEIEEDEKKAYSAVLDHEREHANDVSSIFEDVYFDAMRDAFHGYDTKRECDVAAKVLKRNILKRYNKKIMEYREDEEGHSHSKYKPGGKFELSGNFKLDK